MMAEIIGYLREDKATAGEKRVLGSLTKSLPDDFTVYVECPLHDEDIERMPDFIVLTPFGVIVLEVKDWVEIVEADKYYATIRTRKGEVHRHKNPVNQARDFAHILARKLQKEPRLLEGARTLKVPWGYAAVLPNLPTAVITQLKRPWGRNHVMGKPDLNPGVARKRLEATLPQVYRLRKADIRCVKGVINPVVLIKTDPSRPPVVLDDEQERIVTEKPSLQPVEEKAKRARQEALFPAQPEEPEPDEEKERRVRARPPELDRLTRSCSIRLVRGVAGSGKTLVLTQRARYLAAQHPEWRIGVCTYNRRLAESLRASLKGASNVKAVNFHRLCSGLLQDYIRWSDPCDPEGWIKNRRNEWPIIDELGVEYVTDEVRWIKELGVTSRAEYLEMDRKGRERGLLRGGRQREEVYDVLSAYEDWLQDEETYDWADVPFMVLEGIQAGKIRPEPFDAVLIDEAQDFAPSWIEVLKHLLRAQGGLIFMADDPSQSIYRYYSWEEKGIPVVGRTRWLRIPYRNTREIYQAAYEVIRDDETLRKHLEQEMGITLEPDLTSEYLRSGPRPQIRKFKSEADEFDFIAREIRWLLRNGVDARQMAVLHRRRSGVRKLQSHLRGLGVDAATFHSLKGLEFDTVFITQAQYGFPESIMASEHALSEERRLFYMSMTRARQRLYMSYQDRWPEPLAPVRKHTEQILM
jgi:hypothetical protein